MPGTPLTLDSLAGTTGEWMRGTGPEADIVMSSRIRLARNLAGTHFMTRLTPEQRQVTGEKIRQAIDDSGCIADGLYFPLEKGNPLDGKFLVERHLISKEHDEAQHSRGVYFNRSESVSVMINEEDHIRQQVLQSGLQLETAWKLCSKVDDALEQHLEYAFSPQLGYLTACPTNVGTGMRVSVMLHLLGLVLTRHIEKVFMAVGKLNLAVRGLYGEGTEASGHFYQISNQTTLGRSELDILQAVETVIPTIVRYEHEARQALLEKDRRRLEDRIWRAWGLLQNAHLLPSDEATMLLSAVRLGAQLGILKDIPLSTINKLFVDTQPAHLQKLAGEPLDAAGRDHFRANYVRKHLTGKQ